MILRGGKYGLAGLFKRNTVRYFEEGYLWPPAVESFQRGDSYRNFMLFRGIVVKFQLHQHPLNCSGCACGTKEIRRNKMGRSGQRSREPRAVQHWWFVLRTVYEVRK